MQGPFLSFTMLSPTQSQQAERTVRDERLVLFDVFFCLQVKRIEIIYFYKRGENEIFFLSARAKHPMVCSFNLPGADGEVTGHLIQSEHCQPAHSEQKKTNTFPPA